MSWQDKIEELQRRRRIARELGGAESVARQHAAGKLTARERIEHLLDSGSFREVGALVARAQYDEQGALLRATPANSIIGRGTIAGRAVVVGADDFTIRGGASDAKIVNKFVYADRLAIEMRAPLIRLVESAGGSIKSIEVNGHTIIPSFGNLPPAMVLETVPVVGVALGSCAGLAAVKVAAAHFSVMVRGKSQVFAGGPPVVDPAISQHTDKEDLGGYLVHTRGSGVVDNEAEDEFDAMAQAKRWLSYVPRSVYHLPQRVPPDDRPERTEEELLGIIPTEKRKVYKMRRLLELVFDKGSLFEIAPRNGPAKITCLARLDGYPVGVLASDPYIYAGAMTRDAAQKIETFVDFCDTFHLPVVNLTDQPGIMVGVEAERTGTVRAAIRALSAIDQSRVPWCGIVVRRAYGVAGNENFRAHGFTTRYAWPTGNWGSLPLEGGIAAAYRRELQTHPDPKARIAELEEHFEPYISPYRTAERFGVENIIDPRETRPLLCEWVRLAYEVLPEQLGPTPHGFRR
ncbi:MAG: propionyl-CoA carboxylase [Candidatus Lambdaproteobacteria bacterium]|nr:propionyl-CoA carboxylase [Candidatus Lambdaproteobacteria bacterium]